jgi:arginase family enzyme
MVEQIKIFGAALDALSSIERVKLKQAYLQHLRNRSFIEEEIEDPYDFVKSMTEQIVLKNNIKWLGKISIPSWLTPKPQESDSLRLSVSNLDKFLENDGCWDSALMIAGYISEKIYPGMPVMIGVDHSLSGGPIMVLSQRYPNLNVMVLDAHFDVINHDKADEQGRLGGNAMVGSLHHGTIESGTSLHYYGCGNFLSRLLERGMIAPKNLWIIGVQDEIHREMEERGNLDRSVASVKKWVEKGVHVVFKHEAQSGRFKLDLRGPLYLSVDMDVGSMSSIYSARFMNSYGLNRAEFLQLLQKVSQCVRSSHCPLVGLDLMELDVHFLGAIKEKKIDDRTGEIAQEIFKLFINKERCRYAS